MKIRIKKKIFEKRLTLIIVAAAEGSSGETGEGGGAAEGAAHGAG